ncbi:MAG: hypothetical protein OEU92_08770 [Alphaproteobacteria bacterium]|nr:hypothetical protein [Alphaproteobacteria bacterium]
MLSTFDPHQEVPGNVLIKGEFTSVKVRDPVGPPNVQNLVIDPSKPFDIDVEWELSGSNAPLYLAALDANWSVEAYAESMGPGPEIQIASATVPKNGLAYSTTLHVPASTLPEGNPGNGGPSGVYKLVVTAFLNSSLPGPTGFDIAGFSEGPMIRVENPR